MTRQSYDSGAAKEENILYGVGVPGEVFEVEFERKHRHFANHQYVCYHRDGENNDCAGGVGLVDGAKGESGEAHPNQGVGGDGESEERVALTGVEVEFGQAVGGEEWHEEREVSHPMSYGVVP